MEFLYMIKLLVILLLILLVLLLLYKLIKIILVDFIKLLKFLFIRKKQVKKDRFSFDDYLEWYKSIYPEDDKKEPKFDK